jgi:hypothetical protein
MACAGRFGFRFERFWGIWLSKRLFFDVWTHFSPDLCRRNWRIDQIPHSDEVVSSGRKGEYPSDLVHAAMSGLTQHSDCLQPAEYFLDPFPLNLTCESPRLADHSVYFGLARFIVPTLS